MANQLSYGFTQLRDVMGQRVSKVGVDVVWDAVRLSTELYNRVITGMLQSWAERTVKGQMNFRLPSGGTLQPISEVGKPRPIRVGSSYTVAFPIQGGATAWGDDRVSREMMTVEEVNEFVLTAQRQDADWLRRHMMASILDNVAWTYVDKFLGNLTIQPLANNDSVRYVDLSGAAVAANMYSAQAAAIDNANNPLPTIFTNLNKFPSNNVSEANPIVTYVASSLRSSIEGLTSFEEASRWFIQPGTANDRAVNGLDRYRGFGDRVLGVADDHIIVEWSSLPTGYMVSHATGAGQFLGMREYDAPNLQGFFPETHTPDGALREYRLIRYAGFGVQNRVAAHVHFVGNAAYQIPTGFNAPLEF